MVIGLIGFLFGLYGLMKGNPMSEYLFNLNIGISLFGTAYYNNSEWKKK